MDSSPRATPDERSHLRRRIGRELLGPVVHRYLLGLHQYLSYFDDGRTAFLLCARAGVRIGQLYDLFRRGQPGGGAHGLQLLAISRLLACKATFSRAPEASLELVAREYAHRPVRDVVEGLLRHHPDRLASLDLDREEHLAHADVLPGWLDGPTAEAAALRDYLAETGVAFDRYLDQLVDGRRRAVLLDSGWQATTQRLLAHAVPNLEWRGVYFGVSFLPGADRSVARDAIGVMFEADAVDPSRPETAFIAYRHLIETLLEPNGPSIEEPLAGAFEPIALEQVAANLNEEPTAERDAMFLLARDYVRENAGLGPTEIVARHQQAMPELARMILSPTREEALALAAKDRSADFGKELDVPVLLSGDDPRYATPDLRIQHSLWTPGQIALEFDGERRRIRQQEAAGEWSHGGYFDPHAVEPSEDAGAEAGSRPVVAIITRTKNRSVLLRRAGRSVAAQTYPDYLWVVVNDGGDEDEVRAVIEASGVDRRRVVLVSNARSLGMEAASNAGIGAVASDYLVIHDDDDALDPTFLERTVGLLESPAGSRYGGVITHSTYVSEEIRGDEVVEHGRTPYMDWVRNVHLAEMACGNFFAPISFLYRRSEWERVGGYNETLPVLGDWFFNLEFLLESDIGVIPEQLATYHHRDVGGATGSYSNSVVGGRSKHEEFASIARNQLLRKHANTPLASAILSAHVANDTRARLATIGHQLGTGVPGLQDRAAIGSDDFDLAWTVAAINHAAAAGEDGIGQLDPRFADLDEVSRNLIGRTFVLPCPSNFDEEAYLGRYVDVRDAVENGDVASGYQHYIVYGRAEGRRR